MRRLVLAAGVTAVVLGAGTAGRHPVLAQTLLAQTVPQQQALQSDKEAELRLQQAGYTGVREIKPTADGVQARAVKDGRDVVVVLAPSGEIREQPQRH
jgi:hypothetical protein